MDAISLATDHTSLAARVAEIFTLSRHLAYAQVGFDFYVQQTSPNFANMVRLSESTIRQQPITQLLPPLHDAIPQLQELLQGQRRYYRLDYGDHNNNRPSPSTVHYTLHLYPLDKKQPDLGLLLIMEDRTHLPEMLAQDKNELLLAQKQLAEANAELRRVNQIKSLFMSMAAHDLRTPLTTIFGFADMLLEDLQLQDEIKREILAVIRAQSERLHRLIADLLDVERIEQGQLILKPGKCNLNLITGEVLESLKPLYETRYLHIDTQLPDPPLVVWGDASRIWQILYNLVNNAVKYTPERGCVKIEILSETNRAILRVSDSGRGLTQAQLDRLFDLYYRTEEAKASNVLGTGLGLYIVKMLAEAHEGEVGVVSEPGKGTTFTVWLPLQL
jgi:signal transduction histidine kinase